MGIKVRPPDVTSSDGNFTAVGTDIRCGLTASRNVGSNVVESILATRAGRGRFADFDDFLAKVDPVVCNKKTIESLIKAGAFDSLGHTRRGLHQVHVERIDLVMDVKRNEAVGQFDLFAAVDPAALAGPAGPDLGVRSPIPVEEWDKATLLGFEREMLGLYVSDHPLFGVEHVLAAAADTTVAALTTGEELADGTVVTVGGLLTTVTRKLTKRGDPWAVVTLEDLEGSVEVLVFPSAYQSVGHLLAEDAVVLVRGRVTRRDEAVSLAALDVTLPDLSRGARGPLLLRLPDRSVTPPLVARLREVLRAHPGTTEVQLAVSSRGRVRLLRLDDGLRVAPTTELMADLKELLGPAAIA
jgi:DNA polymerase-3 subunit alpha